MDPLSISVSVVTLLSTILAISKGIHSLIGSIRNVPEDLSSLSNELQDLRVVLSSVELSIKCTDILENDTHLLNVLPTILRRMEDKLTQLEQLIKTFCNTFEGTSTDSTITFKALDWSIRGKDKAKRIKEDISNLKWPVSTCLASLSVASSGHIGQSLTKVSHEVRTLNNDFKQATLAFEEHQRQSHHMIENVRQSQDNMSRLLEAKIDELGSQAAEHGLNMFISGQLHSLLPPTAAAVHLSLQQRSMCVSSCACVCHQWQQLRSPKILDGLIGSILLGYTGVPLVTRKCTKKSCKLKATYALSLQYQFPLWMISHVVTLTAHSRYGKPSAGLSIAQIRPHNSQVFALAESGNVSGLKYAFDHGLASPFDISAQTGDHPLHITASHGYVEASRLLLSYGADPHAHDMNKRNTPHSFAWGIILAKNISPKQQKQMAILFPNVHASLNFPRLHQLALEMKPGSLDAEAQRSDFNINAQDSEGNTVLQWACLRGDMRTAQWLLTKGADPNLPNHNIGRTPLMAACTSVSLSCIKLLLEYGANAKAQTKYGLDALIYLCEEDRNPQPLTEIVEAAKLLISNGADLTPHGENQVFCLARAARTEIVDLMEVIADQGIDLNQKNKFGLTALSRSIAWSKSRSAEFLLRRGAAYTGDVERDSDGRTLLHHAALNPSLEVTRVLITAKLKGLDPDIADKGGLKAEDYLNRAEDLIEGFLPAFRHLLSDMRARFQAGVEEEEDESVNEFVDALEFL